MGSFFLRRAACAAVAVAWACSASSGGSDHRGPQGSGGSAAGSTGGSANEGTGGFSALGVGGASGTAPITDGGECAAVSQTAENEYEPVDIIWAIDNSGSMTFEAGEVQNNMNVFASAILGQGIDVHVAVISEDGPPGLFPPSNGVCIPPPLGSGGPCTNAGDSNPPVYLRIPDAVASTNSLFKLLEHYPTYKSILRKDSLKYFAVVTDDESSMDAATFTTMLNALDPPYLANWKFFGVFCTGTCPVLLACETTGAVYMQLVQQTGGLAGDLCQGQSNFSGVFSALAQSVITGAELSCEWEIPPAPEGQMFEKNKVNVRFSPGGGGPPEDVLFAGSAADCGSEGGWYYDDDASPTKVVACPTTCDHIKADVNGRVDVLFGCFTVSVPR